MWLEETQTSATPCTLADPDSKRKHQGLHLLGCKYVKFSSPYTGRDDEQHLKAVTFLRLGDIPVLIPTVCSMDSTQRAGMRPYLTASGKNATGLTANELVHIIGEYLQQCAQRPKYIVMDRDPTHTQDGVEGRLAQMGLIVRYLPPRSHDLSPPDSHFFAVVKNKWRKKLWESGEHDWDRVKGLFMECARNTDASAHIQDYRLRLQACVLAGGQRFQQQLQHLKAGHSSQ